MIKIIWIHFSYLFEFIFFYFLILNFLFYFYLYFILVGNGMKQHAIMQLKVVTLIA